MVITPNTTLSRNTDIHYAAVNAEEAVMLNVSAGECYALNSVAVRIWELLEQPMTVAQLCARICEEFVIDIETCQTAVLNFATEIVNDGIVHVSETGSPA
jgi:hypothetical protein